VDRRHGVGALGGDVLGDPSALGLDALYPAFFVGLLLSEVRSRRGREAAALGALVALVLVPFALPGVPVLLAGAGALIGLMRRARSEAASG